MADPKYNLETLSRSRRVIRAGDVLALRPQGHDYYFGRVIDPDLDVMSWKGVLVYVYSIHRPDPAPPAELARNQLLIPPIILDRACFTAGLVMIVGNRPLQKDDVLPTHCFYSVGVRRYFDEYRRPVAKPPEPCGTYGLAQPRGLDKAVSEALGIPRVPEG